MTEQTVLACSQCGRTFADSDLVQIAGNLVCSDCKPVFLSRVMAYGVSGASPMRLRYGGFWIRLGARILDGLVLMVPILVILALFIPSFIRSARNQSFVPEMMAGMVFAGILTFFLVIICYEVLMLKYRGATLGKMACGLKVIRGDGNSDLGWGVCIGRFLMWNVVISGIPYLNWILMLVSSIMLGVDDEKRGLHDRACDTRVVYK